MEVKTEKQNLGPGTGNEGIKVTAYVDMVTGRPSVRASAEVGNYHLSVIPNGQNVIEVAVFGKGENGELDVSKELFMKTVTGGDDDIEEVADTFKRRLESGIDPKELSRPEREDAVTSIWGHDPLDK